MENNGGSDNCTDKFDNDFDGDIDCRDADCSSLPVCTTAAPVLSPPFAVMLALLLTLVGLVGLARSRQQRLQA